MLAWRSCPRPPSRRRPTTATSSTPRRPGGAGAGRGGATARARGSLCWSGRAPPPLPRGGRRWCPRRRGAAGARTRWSR
uniref:Uncharacterized protein n=1 Tax=Arundo donax TaxID=35708 RepID=A0A0A9FCN4_ARUDO